MKEHAMSIVVDAIVSSKGQVTLPAAMRAKLGITAGSHIHFELRGNELVIDSSTINGIKATVFNGMRYGSIAVDVSSPVVVS